MKTLDLFRKTNIILYVLNILIIIFLFSVAFFSMRTGAFQMSATETLRKLTKIPRLLPQESLLYSLIIFLFLFASQFIKYRTQKDSLISWLIVFDITACVLLQNFLYINYREIFYIILLNILLFQKGKEKYWFLAVFVSLFVFVDLYNSAQVSTQSSFDLYVSFFPKNTQLIIYTVKFLLFAGFNILFFFNIFMLLSEYTQEKDLALSMYRELAQSNMELKLAYSQLKEYAAEIEKQTVKNERTRMAMEIHDTIGHALTAVVMGLEACDQLLKKNQKSLREDLKNKIHKMKEIAKISLVDIRRSVDSLKPAVFEKNDIISSLQKLFDNLNSTGDIYIDFVYEGNTNLITEDVALHLYRIVQEALTNSIKNGKAKNLKVTLNTHEKIELTITDDGVGCEKIKENHGLFGIRKRIESMSGSVHFFSALNKGFQIKIEVPLSGSILKEGAKIG